MAAASAGSHNGRSDLRTIAGRRPLCLLNALPLELWRCLLAPTPLGCLLCLPAPLAQSLHVFGWLHCPPPVLAGQAMLVLV